jgi:PadR family transcriptional regulator, regulatory protein PadR
MQVTTQTLKILAALMASQEEVSGAEIARGTKLPSGTLYPILMRLEDAKWVRSRWETEDPSCLGRPRRRLYQLTSLGASSAKAQFRELSSMIGGLIWG